ncbi:MAG: hypothetical protein ABW190_03060 [Rhizobacter sp.]
MRWADGTVFEGVAYDYYLFDRGEFIYSGRCEKSRFYGKGKLSVPGKPDYWGFVREDYNRETASPTTEENFNAYVDKVDRCVSQLEDERARTLGYQAGEDAAMSQARATRMPR